MKYEFAMEAIERELKNDPNKIAMISATNRENTMSCLELKRQIQCVEAFLHKRGFGPGDIASTVFPNSTTVLPFFLRVIGRGGTFSGLSPVFKEYEIREMTLCHGSTLVFTTDHLLDEVLRGTADTPVKTINCINPSGRTLPDNVIDWNTVLETTEEAPKYQGEMDDVVTMMYSSGITGLPKGVLITNRNYVAAMESARINFLQNIIPRLYPSFSKEELRGVWRHPQLLQMQMYHIYGNLLAIFFLSLGATAVVMETFDLPSLLAKIQEYKVWNLFFSPPLVLRLTKDRITDDYDLSSLRFVNCSAAPLGASNIRQNNLWKSLLTFALPKVLVSFVETNGRFKVLGMNEALNAFVNDISDDSLSFGIVGPGYEAKIINEEGMELDANCPGEIVVRGPGVMKGYCNNQKATDEAIDKEGWLRTGDVGYFNDKGHLFVLDRMKEIIKVNAVQIAPAELESVLTTDHRIRDAAVIGVPHEESGEAPRAYIVKDSEDLTEDDVRNVIKEKLAPLKWLNGGVVFIDQIPKLLSGKILRRELKRIYASESK